MDDRLTQQLTLIRELDKLKEVIRRTYLLSQSRRENSAEHSWHVAVMALLLAEYAAEPVDVSRVVQMLLVHDLVEIDAGDTPVYDVEGTKTKAAREQAAADRLFGLLAPDQSREFRALWEEFEARATPEAKFAAALDRVQPITHNFYTQGRAWQELGVTLDNVLARNRHIAEGAPILWEYVEGLIRTAAANGWLPA